jgi:hypothetical protein
LSIRSRSTRRRSRSVAIAMTGCWREAIWISAPRHSAHYF